MEYEEFKIWIDSSISQRDKDFEEFKTHIDARLDQLNEVRDPVHDINEVDTHLREALKQVSKDLSEKLSEVRIDLEEFKVESDNRIRILDKSDIEISPVQRRSRRESSVHIRRGSNFDLGLAPEPDDQMKTISITSQTS
jgi:oligoendopeptidase F